MEVHKLKPVEIKQLVPKKSVGSYRLGVFSDENLDVRYFGRSDTDLRRRLLQHAKEEKFSHFTFETANMLFDAFRQECRDWHMNISNIKNCVHPFAPKRLPYVCPYCLIKKCLIFGG